MTKRIKWSLIGVIILFIAGIIVFPKVKDLIFPSEIEENVVPDSGKSFRNQVLSVNAKILSYQSLTDKLITIGSTLPRLLSMLVSNPIWVDRRTGTFPRC